MSNNREDPGFETRTQHVRERFRKLMNPPPPQWQAEPPTEPGWYWARMNDDWYKAGVPAPQRTMAVEVLMLRGSMRMVLPEEECPSELSAAALWWPVPLTPPPLPEGE